MSKTTIHSFIPLERLGEGTFSSVYKVRRVSDGEFYALKKIKIGSLKEKEKANALNEIRILASLSSQHIVTYKQAFFDQNLKLLCIVMEWANEGDLLQKINHHKTKKTQFQQSEIWKIVYHLLKGLMLLHRNKVLHRDMKSANIFISHGQYKIGDLNVSKVIKDQKLVKTQTGTPYYASPEVWRDELYDHKSDIWSLGCIVYQVCALRPPFLGDNLEELNKNIQKGKFPPLPPKYSGELHRFVSSCLSLRPQQRPDSQEFLRSDNILTKCRFYDILQDKEMDRPQPMLATINMPFDIKALNSKLPHSQYDSKQKQSRPSSLPSRHTQSTSKEKDNMKNQSSVLLPDSKNEKNIKNQSEVVISSQNNGNTPLPERIKNHIQSISQNNVDKIINRRPKYRIQTSVVRQKPVISHLDSLNAAPNSRNNIKKVRPFSCEVKNRQIPNIRPLSGLQSKVRRMPRSFEQKSQSKRIESAVMEENHRYLRPGLYNARLSQQRRVQNQRCRSAQYRQINSSYLQLKKRLQNRGKHFNSSAVYPQNRIKTQNHEQVVQSCANLISSDKYVPFITKDVYIRNGNLLKRGEKIVTPNRQYLQEIQNKILSSGAKNKKCANIVSSGVDFEMDRLKNVCNRYNQGSYIR